VACGSAGPCYLRFDTTKSFLLTANYGGGSVAVVPLLAGGKISEASGFVQHHGSGPNPARQDNYILRLLRRLLTNSPSRLTWDWTSCSSTNLIPAKVGFRHPYHRLKGTPRQRAATLCIRPNRQFLYLVNEIDSSVSGWPTIHKAPQWRYKQLLPSPKASPDRATRPISRSTHLGTSSTFPIAELTYQRFRDQSRNRNAKTSRDRY
jgi:hypothetical protein